MSEYVVYKFTNMINGKSYIGKSKRIKRRFQEHVNGSVWRIAGKQSCISKAIGKYGIENFSFEILKECSSPEEMNEKEFEFILEYDTISPNGYNLRLGIDNKSYIHDETKKKISVTNQGIRHAKKENIGSQYIGVTTSLNKFRTCVRINRKIKTKTYNSEIEAAEAYDKMVLFLYGANARINFEEKREEYLKEDLQQFYNSFIEHSIKKKSQYKFVSSTSKNKWIVKPYIPKHKKSDIPSIDFGTFESEESAAEMVDKFNFYFNLSDKFNFPNKITEYNRQDLESFFDSKRIVKTSKYEGVCKNKYGKYRSYFYINRKQIFVGDNFLTEEDAYFARINAIKNHQEKS